jgi:ice-binding like protein/flagellar hook capping protein FlgD
VFIFQMGSTFTSTAGRQIILTGGAKAANIFWQVGSSATLGASSVFKGNILALASITAGAGAAVEGRLLARTAAVTLDASVIGSAPAASASPAAAAARGPGTTATATAMAASGAAGVANRFSFSSNPLRSGPATVRFGLARADRVEIKVYDVGGRVVRTVVNGGFEAGEHEVAWDRLDSSGSPVSSGLYFARVTYYSQGFVAIKKLTIIE